MSIKDQDSYTEETRNDNVIVKIKDSVTSIEKEMFKDRSDITSLTIPNSVTSIGDEAFEGCTGLQTIIIPDSVTSLGKDAFKSCDITVYLPKDLKPSTIFTSTTIKYEPRERGKQPGNPGGYSFGGRRHKKTKKHNTKHKTHRHYRPNRHYRKTVRPVRLARQPRK